jgi:hypothetical protein
MCTYINTPILAHSMTTTGSRPADNLKHIVFNNGCHDSVGGQPTPG